MSQADRRKWDARYAEGAYRTRTYPSAFLASIESRLPSGGRALDLGCGAGRNAIYFARLGFEVDAVDISAVALARGRKDAQGLPIHWIERDLDDGFETEQGYDLIVNIRFVQMDLVPNLIPRLRPGGVLVIEQHLRTDMGDATGPRNPAFRVAPGALADIAGPLDVECLAEDVFEEPDGSRAALARLFARRSA